jgi:glycerol-3-phosphate O-acyltransferase
LQQTCLACTLLAADPAQATTNAQLEKHQKDCKPWLVQLRYSQNFNTSLPSSQTQGRIKKRSKTMKMKPIRKLKKATCGIPPPRTKTVIEATKH